MLGHSQRLPAVAAVLVGNLLLFLAVVTLPAFQAAHHHWIFPVFGVLLAAQWALTFVPARIDRFLERRLLRGNLVSMLVFLLVIGVTRHETILTCFDRCSFKLAGAALIAGLVFVGQALARDKGFWDPLRSYVAAAGALLWALALLLRGLHMTNWLSGLLFAILALLFWLGRASAPFLIASVGIVAALAVRATANEFAIIGLGTMVCVVLPLAAASRVEAWLAKRGGAIRPAAPEGSRGRRLLASAGRIAAAVAVLAGLGRFVVGPLSLVTDPAKRRAYLLTMAPKGPPRDPKELSALAARLRGHVVMLAQTIGERDAFNLKGRDRAREYVRGRLAAAGYSPKVIPYESRYMPGVPNGTAFHNVEALLRVRSPEPRGAWIVGAHYDSAPGTPGSDDNASGTAVMLELARLMKERHPSREIRFVGFGTEEPPSFGSRNMGSWHYASRLKDDGVGVHGALILEMLGYYNSRPGSQLYPPFLQLFFPDHADFIGAVANVPSRGLLSDFKRTWKSVSRFPLVPSILPGPFSSLALSDQLNFWELGFPALMISDTAFYRNANYHESTDVPDTLDYEKMAEVTTALAAIIEEAP